VEGDVVIVGDYDDEIAELRRMQDRLRVLRDRLCVPKNDTNVRYHGLSLAVSGINRAIADMEAEARI
jgi:hypothetical protein